ncbi:MAG: NADH-quinone oxidoreductase subunit NuoN [Burkholderiales bacterium]
MMNFSPPNLMPALPEIFLLAMVSVVLIADLFTSEKNRSRIYTLSQIAIAGSALLTIYTFARQPVFTFNGMFVDDALSDVLKIMLYIAVSIVLVYSRDYIAQRGMFRGEFFTLVLFALLGMMVMVSANHFMTLYLGLELLALSLYALVALQRDSAKATEAAMKYFILGALASGLLLYGMSMLYGATGSLDLAKISASILGGTANKSLLVFGLVFVIAGLAFKLGAVPFHMWVPDVYHGAPTAITLFIGTAPKLAAFGFIMRLLVSGLQGLVADWQSMLIILALLSMAIGNVTAIAQTNIKRMLAYSTISHMGFLLLGILAGNINGYSSAMFYVIAYVLMSLGAFGMVIMLSRAGFEADELDDFRGLNKRSPWFAAVMLFIMFSMAGIPFFIGFWAKLSVLQAAWQAGFTKLVVAAVMLSLVGAYYYLRVVKLMYMDEPVDKAPLQAQTDMRFIMTLNGLAILLLGVLPGPLMSVCQAAIQQSLRF